MFTGLVQSVGRVLRLAPRGRGCRLLIESPQWHHVPSPGESISVNGCCLTHAPEESDAPGAMGFDVVEETLSKTTLGSLKPGDGVNLEPSLRAGGLVGGHFVQGHVEGLARVLKRENAEGAVRLRLSCPGPLRPCVVPKGSVALEGVSLTVAAVDPVEGWFEVALIPTTLKATNLDGKIPGQDLNLETDILVRSVVWNLQGRPAGDSPFPLIPSRP